MGATIVKRDRFAMFQRYLTAAALVLLVAAGGTDSAGAQDDTYTVADVHVDVTAATGTAARDKAVAEGQQKAYEMLMAKLGAKAPRIGVSAMNEIVTGFEVANERVSGVRYIADYTFHFNPDAVRKLVQGAAANDGGGGTAPPPVAARPVLVLPVLQTGDRGVLWDDPNPWRNLWAGRAGTVGGVAIVVPAGDLPDVHAIDADAATRGDARAIAAISARYQNDDVLVVQGVFGSDPRRLDVTAVLYPANGAGDVRTISLSEAAKPSEGDGEMMRRGVADTLRQLVRMVAMTAPPPSAGGGNGDAGGGSGDTGPVLTARLKSSSLADWIAVRDRLKTIPTIKSSVLLAADRGEMKIAIHYVGDEAKLKAALHSHDLDLAGSDSDWSLERRGSLLPKPAEPPPAAAPAPGDSTRAPAVDPLRRADDRP